MTSIGIIGNGFVGNAIYQNFKDKLTTRVYDILESKRYNSLDETLTSNIVFICLPTPMKHTGECNLNYVIEFFKEVSPSQCDTLFVLKSTVPIGTTDHLLQIRPDLKIVHNPEFLTAVNAVEDFNNADRTIIGGRQEWCLTLSNFYKVWYPHTPIQIVKSAESETIKYFCNSFLAAKITLFNNLYQICTQFNIDYESVRSGVISDSRIGKSHSKVPGPDGELGFGGYCFPKDINALINTLKENNLDASLFECIWEFNKKLRNDL